MADRHSLAGRRRGHCPAGHLDPSGRPLRARCRDRSATRSGGPHRRRYPQRPGTRRPILRPIGRSPADGRHGPNRGPSRGPAGPGCPGRQGRPGSAVATLVWHIDRTAGNRRAAGDLSAGVGPISVEPIRQSERRRPAFFAHDVSSHAGRYEGSLRRATGHLRRHRGPTGRTRGAGLATRRRIRGSLAHVPRAGRSLAGRFGQGYRAGRLPRSLLSGTKRNLSARRDHRAANRGRPAEDHASGLYSQRSV